MALTASAPPAVARPALRRVLRRPPRWARREATRLQRTLWRRIAVRGSYDRISGGRRRLQVQGRHLRAGNLTISRQSLHRALVLLVIYRYCDQERLWAAGRATSALMGILWSYLGQMLRLVRSRTGAYRLYWAAPALWFAGANDNPTDISILGEEGAARLVACFPEVERSRRWAERMDRGGFLVMLDSGGYQAWKRGAPVDRHRWADFVRQHEDRLLWYVQLDDPAGGVETNRALLLWAEAEGLAPIPVFHVSMPDDYLEWLLDRGYPVIAIGGHVGMAKAVRRARISAVRARIRSWAREHVLGALDPEAWSSDCSNWLEARRSGAVLTDAGQRRLTRRGEKVPWNWRDLTRLNVRYLTDLQRRLESGRVQLTFCLPPPPTALSPELAALYRRFGL